MKINPYQPVQQNPYRKQMDKADQGSRGKSKE